MALEAGGGGEGLEELLCVTERGADQGSGAGFLSGTGLRSGNPGFLEHLSVAMQQP